MHSRPTLANYTKKSVRATNAAFGKLLSSLRRSTRLNDVSKIYLQLDTVFERATLHVLAVCLGTPKPRGKTNQAPYTRISVMQVSARTCLSMAKQVDEFICETTLSIQQQSICSCGFTIKGHMCNDPSTGKI